MSATATVSLAEYLASSYRPDREYLEGTVEERHTGEFDHSRLQYLIARELGACEEGLDAFVLTDQRVQVRRDRYRVPDVCLIRRADREQIIRRPPLVCVEILSPEDTMSAMQERIEEYLEMGVPAVWLVNPRLRRGYVYKREGMRPAIDGKLQAEPIQLVVDLTPLFAQL